MKPNRRPANPCFSSGPCAKRPGWSPAVLADALSGRSHRSAAGLARIVEVVERSRALRRVHLCVHGIDRAEEDQRLVDEMAAEIQQRPTTRVRRARIWSKPLKPRLKSDGSPEHSIGQSLGNGAEV